MPSPDAVRGGSNQVRGQASPGIPPAAEVGLFPASAVAGCGRARVRAEMTAGGKTRSSFMRENSDCGDSRGDRRMRGGRAPRAGRKRTGPELRPITLKGGRTLNTPQPETSGFSRTRRRFREEGLPMPRLSIWDTRSHSPSPSFMDFGRARLGKSTPRRGRRRQEIGASSASDILSAQRPLWRA